MARSWAHPRFIGFEIKVSRSDFLQDVKWTDYLSYCSEFYFVIPHGIVEPTEVPEQAGLMVGTKNNKRLLIKKKAPVRNVEIPNSILIYILMSRTRIVGDMHQTRPAVEIWKTRLKEFMENKRIGSQISWIIRNEIEKKMKEIKNENRQLRLDISKYEGLEEFLNQKNMKITDFITTYNQPNQNLLQKLSGLPFDFVEYLKEIERNISLAKNILEKEL